MRPKKRKTTGSNDLFRARLALKWLGLRLVPSAAQSGYVELCAARFFQANQNDAPLSPREEIKWRQ
jgi:hypothetical protein